MVQIIDTGSVEKLTKKLCEKLKASDSRNYAACFDVDETLLFWDESGKDIATIHPHIKPLYDKLVELGYAIFIITARPKTEPGIKYVAKQLRGLGYDLTPIPLSGIYMQPKDYYDNNLTGRFKYDVRKHIQDKYKVKIILMVGDQFTDIFPEGKNDFRKIKDVKYKGESEKVMDSLGIIVANPDDVTSIGFKLPSVH